MIWIRCSLSESLTQIKPRTAAFHSVTAPVIYRPEIDRRTMFFRCLAPLRPERVQKWTSWLLTRAVSGTATTLLTCVITIIPGTVQALEKVSLQLKWLHQFQFAGYYVALEKGYYRDAAATCAWSPTAISSGVSRTMSSSSASDAARWSLLLASLSATRTRRLSSPSCLTSTVCPSYRSAQRLLANGNRHVVRFAATQ